MLKMMLKYWHILGQVRPTLLLNSNSYLRVREISLHCPEEDLLPQNTSTPRLEGRTCHASMTGHHENCNVQCSFQDPVCQSGALHRRLFCSLTPDKRSSVKVDPSHPSTIKQQFQTILSQLLVESLVINYSTRDFETWGRG